MITATAALHGEIHLPYECFQGKIGSAKMMGKFGDAFHRVSTQYINIRFGTIIIRQYTHSHDIFHAISACL